MDKLGTTEYMYIMVNRDMIVLCAPQILSCLIIIKQTQLTYFVGSSFASLIDL